MESLVGTLGASTTVIVGAQVTCLAAVGAAGIDKLLSLGNVHDELGAVVSAGERGMFLGDMIGRVYNIQAVTGALGFIPQGRLGNLEPAVEQRCKHLDPEVGKGRLRDADLGLHDRLAGDSVPCRRGGRHMELLSGPHARTVTMQLPHVPA